MTRKIWNNTEVSAYLDGALTPKNQAALEADMAQDPNLHRRVEELRNVATMVRSVPLRQPPRNYLLTPSMVAESKPDPDRRRRPLWVMRLATSLVAAAFVVSFGVTLLQQGVTPDMVTKSSEAPQISLMQESEPAADAAIQERAVAPEAVAPETAAPEMAEVAEEEAPAILKMQESTPLSPEDEMALASEPESGEAADVPEATPALGIGGGMEPPVEPGSEEPAAPSGPSDTSPGESPEEPAAAGVGGAETEAMEAPQAEAPAADGEIEALEAPLAMEAPREPEAAPMLDAEPEGMELGYAADDMPAADNAPAADDMPAEEELPAPAPMQATTDRDATVAPSRRGGVPLGLTIGLGAATLVLTVVTIWLSRRQAG